jgi:Glycosyl transferase family 64 domain
VHLLHCVVLCRWHAAKLFHLSNRASSVWDDLWALVWGPDIYIPCKDIERGFSAWRRHPERLVGYVPRLIDTSPPQYRFVPSFCAAHVLQYSRVPHGFAAPCSAVQVRAHFLRCLMSCSTSSSWFLLPLVLQCGFPSPCFWRSHVSECTVSFSSFSLPLGFHHTFLAHTH